MTRMHLVLVLLLTVLVGAGAYAQSSTKTGTSAAAFLKIGVGPRAIGMGGAFAATADDITAIYWNPSGLANVFASEAYFNHVYWIADVRYDVAAVSTNIASIGTIAVFFNVLSMDDMDVRTIEAPEGTGERFSAGGIVGGLSYARNLTDNFSIGFTAKYIRENIWHSSATGFGLDIGTLYKIPILNEFRLAASISNFGTKMKMEGRDALQVMQVGGTGGNLINTYVELDEYDLPLVFRVGVAADVIKSESIRLTAEVDAIHPNDNTEYLNTGLEVGWNDLAFLRAGMKSLFERDTEQGFTFGLGISPRLAGSLKVKFDYAYEDFGRLKNVQYISLGVVF